jgi:hypothetical protein
MVALLTLITQQLAAISNGTHPNLLPSSPPSRPISSVVCVNYCWFLSLVFSLSSALAATLVKGWIRNYQETTDRPSSTLQRVRTHAYLNEGLTKYNMSMVIGTIPTLLHISLFLFFVGFIAFLYPIYRGISMLIGAALAIVFFLYIAISPISMFYGNWPYKTPFYGVFWLILFVLSPLLNRFSLNPYWISEHFRSGFRVRTDLTPERRFVFFNRPPEDIVMDHPDRDERDFKALKRFFIKFSRDDSVLDRIVEAVPQFIRPTHHTMDAAGFLLMAKLMADKEAHLGLRLAGHLQSCNGRQFAPEPRMRRIIACFRALWPLACWMPLEDFQEIDREAVLKALDHDVLSGPEALSARCIQACYAVL